MVVAICVLLAGVAIGFTLMVRERDVPPAPVENPELKHLETRRQVLYENLKDLQFEFHQGKLTDADYQSLKQGFLYDLAGVMDSIERIELRKGKHSRTAPRSQHFSEPEASSKSHRDHAIAVADSNVCPSCQASNPPGNRFCGSCGAALQS
jgi:zinc ribbon protein